MTAVYLLQHESDPENVKVVGIYPTEVDAIEAEQRAARLPGFREAGGHFSIDRYMVGQDQWTEGFVSVGSRDRVDEDPVTPRAA